MEISDVWNINFKKTAEDSSTEKKKEEEKCRRCGDSIPEIHKNDLNLCYDCMLEKAGLI